MNYHYGGRNHIEYFKLYIEKGSGLVYTTAVQLYSVIVFMEALGYSPTSKTGWAIDALRGYQETSPKCITSPKFISFKDACKLHNGTKCRVVGGDEPWLDILQFKYTLHIPKVVMDEALKSKFVERVKLQKLKKFPYVKVQSHYVKLMGESENLFLISERF